MLREDKGDMSPTTAFQSLSVRAPPSPHENSALDDIFGDAPTPQPAASSQLDDIFGCSPPRDTALAVSDASVGASSHDVSDIPRLRSVHVTAGYRDGIAESKADHVQDGFDEGFPLGAVLGLKAGWILGGLEGIAMALKSAALAKARGVSATPAAVSQNPAEAYEAVRQQLLNARKELDIVSIFGQDYFDEEGIWRYHVQGQEEDVTFEDVAAQHPLVSKWLSTVDTLAETTGVDLHILDRRARDESDDEAMTIG